MAGNGDGCSCCDGGGGCCEGGSAVAVVEVVGSVGVCGGGGCWSMAGWR